MKIGILAGALLCALVSAPSIAQTMPPKPQIGGHGDNVQTFIAEFDTDGDGRVTWAEFEQFRRTRFDATDGNHDGTLSEAEYVQEFADRLHAQLAGETAAQMKQTDVRFDALDTDKNGTVSRGEFDAAGEKTWQGGQRALTERGGKADKAMPDRAGRSPGLLSMPTSHSAEGFLALYDTDGDGKVTRPPSTRAAPAACAPSATATPTPRWSTSARSRSRAPSWKRCGSSAMPGCCARPGRTTRASRRTARRWTASTRIAACSA